MNFSREWEEIYSASGHMSVWPWSDLVSLVKRHAPDIGPGWRVLDIGCGAGANVAFFRSLGVDYYGIDGSAAIIAKLKDEWPDWADRFHACDFTQGFHYDGPFDLVIDRGSLPHNTDAGIRCAVRLARAALRQGGRLISVDWCSHRHYGVNKGNPAEDPYTRTNISEGALAGTGRVHFSDEKNIRDIFSDWRLDYLMHKTYEPVLPDTGYVLAFWNIVSTRI